MPETPWYEKEELVRSFAKRNFASPTDGTLGGPSLKTERQNLHATKKEFLEELAFVVKSADDLFALYQGLNSRENPKEFNPYGISYDFFRQAIDRRKAESRPNSALDLVLDNIRNIGYFTAMKRIIFDLYLSFSSRKADLEEQQKLFWSTKGRPPDHYARIMALRLAKLYGQKRLMKPTIGTSSDGDHPSTEYGRLLQELFEILDIETGFRLPAEWAIEQLDEKDFSKPKPMNILGMARRPNLGKFGTIKLGT